MLPEKLSNEICSLEPEKNKRAFSMIFTIDKEGNILKERAKTIICQTIDLLIQRCNNNRKQKEKKLKTKNLKNQLKH